MADLRLVAAYVGEDYPRAWPIPMAGPVLMPLENTVRYAIDSPDGEREWDAMTPGNGIIHLGKHKQPFSISMFHRKNFYFREMTSISLSSGHRTTMHFDLTQRDAVGAENESN